MKVIIAGSRSGSIRINTIHELLSAWKPAEIVSGACGRPDDENELLFVNGVYQYANGIDGEGERYSINFLEKPPKRFPAQWTKEGLKAGPLRNKVMAQYADALLLIWDGKSKGSASMLKEAKIAGIPTIQVIRSL